MTRRLNTLAIVLSLCLLGATLTTFRGPFQTPLADSVDYFSVSPRATLAQIATALNDHPGVYYGFDNFVAYNVGSPVSVAIGATLESVRALVAHPRICTSWRPDLGTKYDDTNDHTLLVGLASVRYCADTAVNNCTTWEGYLTRCQGGANPGTKCIVGDSTCTGGGVCGAASEKFNTDWVLRVPREEHDALVTDRWGGADPFADPVPGIHNWSTLLDVPAIRALENGDGVPALYAGYNSSSAPDETFIGSVVMDLRQPAYRAWAIKQLITVLNDDYQLGPDDDHCIFWGYKPGWWGYESDASANLNGCRAAGDHNYAGHLWGVDKPAVCPEYQGWSSLPFHDTQYGVGEYEAATNAMAVELLAALDAASLWGVKVMIQRAPSSYSTTLEDEIYALYHSRRYIGEIELATLASPPICANGIDEDGDGLTDYPQDTGCNTSGDGSELGGVECDNGADDDGDGLTDHLDPGCSSPGDGSERGTRQCDDGADNDADGLVDYLVDPQCGSPYDALESGNPQCGDGVDNDSDTDIDYPDDAQCTSASDTSEASCGDGSVGGGETCDDGDQIIAACEYGDASPYTQVCNTTCTALTNCASPRYCGDSTLQADDGETCDDGNTSGGDGCSAVCQTESTSAIAAATAVANSTTNTCDAIRPFYWEMGTGASSLVSGSVGDATYTAATSIPIASASKWLYGAYVAELRSGTLTALDKRHLSLTSGYHGFPDGAGNIIACLTGQTVVGCAYYQSNEVKTSGDVDKFYYNGGSLQIHAATGSGIGAGLGALYSAGLATEMRAKLGTEIALSYGQPRPDGGITTTPGDYATFLRKLVAGTYDLTALLGTDAQCAYLGGGCDAVFTPIPADEQWHYSLGHWVEDDPTVGDGAFSSPGWFGFYPWVDATKSTYGIVARVSTAPTAAFDSADCGRMIRKAYASPTLVECNNGLDDDGDNLVDMGDAGCASSGDTIESNCGDGSVRGAEECDDGNTSSGDGCSSTCETEVSASECSDGIDNDADGSIDYPWDSGCTLATDTSE